MMMYFCNYKGTILHGHHGDISALKDRELCINMPNNRSSLILNDALDAIASDAAERKESNSFGNRKKKIEILKI